MGDHEDLLKPGKKDGFKWNQREEFMEDRIGSLDIWYGYGRRVRYK